MAAGFRLNFAGLVEIANEVNDSVCAEIAERTAARARSTAPRVSSEYADSIHVERDERTGKDDFAHHYVVADAPHALVVEMRTGNLARALEG